MISSVGKCPGNAACTEVMTSNVHGPELLINVFNALLLAVNGRVYPCIAVLLTEVCCCPDTIVPTVPGTEYPEYTCM
jgi:hypothetical protein